MNEQAGILSFDSTVKKHGDTTFITIVTHKDLNHDCHVIDYVRALAWPIVILLIAFILKNKISELEGLGLKAKLNLGVPEKQIEAIQKEEDII